MRTYRLLGVSKYAERYLSSEDIMSIEDMIGCEVTESDEKSIVDGGIMIDMPDGIRTHIDFLELEQIQPEFNFNQSNK